MTMRALITREADGQTQSSVESITESQLPQDGDVLVKVLYSTLNYKDGLCLSGAGGLVKNYPHVAGIDFVGVVEESENSKYTQGEHVILTGWRVGEIRWGGYAQKARVNAQWLVPLPDGLTAQHAMAVGTAGLTAMLAVLTLEKYKLAKQDEVLVTGAAGGVGSIAVSLLAAKGYNVAAVTGRPQMAEYLRGLGAHSIVEREEIGSRINRPLESERWAGCVDTVGGDMLARILGQMRYGSAVAAVGLAGGVNLTATVIPFLLRAVSLVGIDSVMQSYENRLQAWQQIDRLLPRQHLESMMQVITLDKVPQMGEAILQGKVKGRVVVDVAGS